MHCPRPSHDTNTDSGRSNRTVPITQQPRQIQESDIVTDSATPKPDADGVFEAEGDDEIEPQIDEYDLTSSPNDFNVATIFDFIQRGSVQIPDFNGIMFGTPSAPRG